jgi:hypothetical protein
VGLLAPLGFRDAWLLTVLAGVGLAACFPREDLGSHSAQTPPQGGGGDATGNTGGSAGAAGGGSGGVDASGGAEGEAGSSPGSGGSEVPPPILGPDSGVAGSGSPETGPPPAGEVACEAAGGVLSPSRQTCLVVRQAPLDFDDALSNCEQTWSGTLVEIDSEPLDDLITSLLTEADAGNAWIGLADPDRNDGGQTPGPLEWQDGDAYVDGDFGNWGGGQPDGLVDQFCVEKRMTQLDNGEDPGLWYDQPCDGGRAYVCERGLDSFPTP